MRLILPTILAACIGIGFAAAALAQSAVPRGLWFTQGGDAKVRIERCGAGLLCGSIAWLKSPIDPSTRKPVTDSNNPNPAHRSRPLIGVRILLGMRAVAPNRWSGKIYNAEDGQIYNGSVTLLAPNRLKIEGCVLAICGSEMWAKATDRARR